MEFLMFASQECSSACVAPFSYGNWSSMSCSSSYQLSRPCLSFCWVIQVVWSFKVCFSGSHTALPGCVAPFWSIGLNWSNMSCSSSYQLEWKHRIQQLKPQCRKELFSFIDVFVFQAKYKVEELWWSKPVNSTVRILGPNWIRTRLFLLEITGVIVSNWIASCESVAQVFREQQLNYAKPEFRS